jgi:hypothetical protein
MLLTSCSPCRAGRLLLGRRPGAPRRKLAFPPAAAVPPAPAWRGPSPPLRKPQDRQQVAMQVLAIKLGFACFHIVMAVVFLKSGFVLLGLANLYAFFVLLRLFRFII